MTANSRPIVQVGGQLQELQQGDRLNLANLPTSSAGLQSGDLWVDTSGGQYVIKVVA